MLVPKLINRSQLIAFNGVGFFKIPGQVAALHPVIVNNVKAASTSSGLWSPKLGQVCKQNVFFVFRLRNLYKFANLT